MKNEGNKEGKKNGRKKGREGRMKETKQTFIYVAPFTDNKNPENG